MQSMLTMQRTRRCPQAHRPNAHPPVEGVKLAGWSGGQFQGRRTCIHRPRLPVPQALDSTVADLGRSLPKFVSLSYEVCPSCCYWYKHYDYSGTFGLATAVLSLRLVPRSLSGSSSSAWLVLPLLFCSLVPGADAQVRVPRLLSWVPGPCAVCPCASALRTRHNIGMQPRGMGLGMPIRQDLPFSASSLPVFGRSGSADCCGVRPGLGRDRAQQDRR